MAMTHSAAETPAQGRSDLTLQALTTEGTNEASSGFDTKSALEIARIINHEDAKIAAAVKKALPEIAQVIDTVTRCQRMSTDLFHPAADRAVHHGRRTQGARICGRSQ
jgi:N-acetylmuramic acid 6-phosphate etherase